MKRKKSNSIAAQARKAGISSSVVYARLNQGWKLKSALETPVKRYKKEYPPTVDPYIAKHAPKVEQKTQAPIVVEHHHTQSNLVRFGLPALVIIMAIIILIK